MEKNTIYDVDYFIKKFEAIPEDKWCTGSLGGNGKHCALGHCGMTRTIDATYEATMLAELFVKYLRVHKFEYDWVFHTVYPINDSKLKYNLPTPKQRILAALHDIKKLQEKPQPTEQTREDITKSLAVLPPDEKPDLKITAPISSTVHS